MAMTFYLSASNSDLTGGADFSKQLVTTTETPGTISVAVAGAATEVSYAWNNAGSVYIYNNTGTFTIEVNVTTANANITIAIALARVNSAGTQQAVTAYTATQSAGTTGVKTFTITNPALGSWATGDRLRVQYQFVNSAMNNQTVVIQTGTTSTEVITPFYQEYATLYWVGGTGTWDTSTVTNWAITSGGTGGASAPSKNTDVIFDVNSDAGSPFTVTLSGSPVCKNLTSSGLDQTMTLAGTTPAFYTYGNTSISSTNFSMTYSGAFYFSATSGTQTISASGVTFSCDVVKDFFTSTVQLSSNLTISTSKGFFFNQGTLDLNAFVLSTGAFSSSQTTTRSILFGTSKIILTGDVANLWNCSILTNFSYTGTSLVEVTSTGTTSRNIGNGSSAGLTESNAVSFTIIDGGNVNLTGGCDNLIINSTFTRTFNFLTNPTYVYGNFTIGTNSTVSSSGSTYPIQFAASSGTQTITTNNKTVTCAFIKSGAGTLELNGNWTANTATNNNITLLEGTFDAKTFNVSIANFSGTGTTARTLNMGSGTWTMGGSGGTVWDLTDTTNLTFNAGTANIVLGWILTTTPRTFAGGSLTYNNLTLNTNITQTTITGSNTFATVAKSGTAAITIILTAGTTTTVSGWTIQGTAGNLVTLNSSSAGSQATLAKTGGGTVVANYYNIKDSNATPANTWYYGTGTTDQGNNTGWNFATINNAQFLQFFN